MIFVVSTFTQSCLVRLGMSWSQSSSKASCIQSAVVLGLQVSVPSVARRETLSPSLVPWSRPEKLLLCLLMMSLSWSPACCLTGPAMLPAERRSARACTSHEKFASLTEERKRAADLSLASSWERLSSSTLINWSISVEGLGREEHVLLDGEVRLPDQAGGLVAEVVSGSQLGPVRPVGPVQVSLRRSRATQREVTVLSLRYILNLNQRRIKAREGCI